MADVVNLAEKTNNNKFIIPEELLSRATNDIKEGKIECDKMMIIGEDSIENTIHFYSSNLRHNEQLGLLARMAYLINKTMD